MVNMLEQEILQRLVCLSMLRKYANFTVCTGVNNKSKLKYKHRNFSALAYTFSDIVQLVDILITEIPMLLLH